MNNNLHYNLNEKPHEIIFKEVEKPSPQEKTVIMNGRQYVLIGDAKEVFQLLQKISEIDAQGKISLPQLKAILVKLGAKEESIRLPFQEVAEKAKKVSIPVIATATAPKSAETAPQTLGKWATREKELLGTRREDVARKYFELAKAGKRVQHNGLKDFLVHTAQDPSTKQKIEQEFVKALAEETPSAFVALFRHLSYDQVRRINDIEDLDAIRFSPVTKSRHNITPDEIRNLQQFMEDKGFSGVVSLSDGEKSYEVRSKKINNSDLPGTQIPFSIHSVGKMFTGVLALQLIEKGLISEQVLDQPVAFDKSVKLPEHIQKHLSGHKITLRQLMHHESGLRDYLEKYEASIDKALTSQSPPPQIKSPENLLQYADEEVGKPGVEHYSNVGMILAGLAVQHYYNEANRDKNDGTDKSYEALLQEFVVKPAQMKVFSSTAPAQACFNKDNPVSAHFVGNPSGGFFTTAEDLRKFGEWVNHECQKKDGRFFKLVEQYGGEFYRKENRELAHSGDITSASAYLSTFLDNGMTIAIVSDKEHNGAARLCGDIFEHMLSSETTQIHKSPSQIAVENGLLSPVPVPGGLSTKPQNIEQRMRELGVPGVSIAVINDGQIEWSQGYGELNKPDSVFQAASISKTITGVTVLSLIEECRKKPQAFPGGTIDLDTDVRDILGEKFMESIDPNGITKTDKMTIRHLLSHTAGTTVSGFGGYPRPEKIDEEIAQLKKEIQDSVGNTLKQKKDRLKELQNVRAQIPDKGLPSTDDILKGKSNSGPVQVVFPPGSDLKYSGGGTMILQKIVEVVTKKSFSEVVENQVFKKLGMHSTYNPKEQDTVQGHGIDSQPVPGKWHEYPELAAAGLWTTPTDLAKLAIAIQQSLQSNKPGTQRPITVPILGPELAKEMITMQSQHGPTGLGVFVEPIGDTTYFIHPGENMGIRNILIANDRGQGAVIMTNSDNGEYLYEEILKSIAAVYKWPGEKGEKVLPMLRSYVPEKISPIHTSGAKWGEKLVGKYVNKGGKEEHTVTISIVNGEIQAKLDKEDPFTLLPLGDSIEDKPAEGEVVPSKSIVRYQRYKPGPSDVLKFSKNPDGAMSFRFLGENYVRTD